MPRFLLVCVLVLVGSGCFFDADYRGQIRCGSDQRCPSDLICHQERCVTTIPVDAAPGDTPVEAIDARVAALTCADPGVIPATGGSVAGTTFEQFSRIAATCGGFVMNGADDVYRIDLATSAQLLVAVDSQGREAYVLSTCSANPGICVGGMYATSGNPINVTVGAGTSYVVVDTAAAIPGGPYVVTVTVN